jgi:hypothetical protein
MVRMMLPPFIIFESIIIFIAGIPVGIAIERWRIHRAMKRLCPDALKTLHEERKI